MRRTEITRDDGTWTGLSLEVQSRRRPGLCLFSAERRLLLSQESRPVLLAAVDEGYAGVEFWRTDAHRSVVPPLRAEAGRALAGHPDRWAHRFARHLLEAPGSPLHDGRWLLSGESPLLHWNHGRLPQADYWASMLIAGHPDGCIDWYVHSGSWEILPLRPMPAAGDGRVKAYRRQAREGTLPPVLLWWVSGLDCHLILDGHARLAAAIAESIAPPLVHLHRTSPSDEVLAGTERAVHCYESALARFAELRAVHGTAVPDGAALAGPPLARRIRELHTAPRPTWAWPLPGGEAQWRRVAREVTAGRRGTGGVWPPA
ncbi:hypothetical protein [Streptomyces tropicalis]|uniref:Uncharacterized protein n=1 Tax=Streptomyces tropicalis TaxID=3034234 RepID=A0ABT6A9W8_9ACTN|nr:hypothetical protein [Streptomyces tropicalis]MDF3301450.1 hypothetical protein [Streptomyces tropicalis]